MLFETLDFYFPSSQRTRFEKIATAFEREGQMHWIERANANSSKIGAALKALGEWSDQPDSELLIMGWDDEVFFFYILRTQFIFARLAARPDDMIPGTADDFWEWAMTLKDDEPWMIYPVATASACKASGTTPIWRIPYPCDYPGDRPLGSL